MGYKASILAGVLALAVFGLSQLLSTKSTDHITSPGWDVEIFADDLKSVDNIVFDDEGRLYASTELGNGQGAVVVVSEDRKTTIIEDLDRADGLALFSDKLYVTEENKGGRVLEFNLLSKHITEVAVLQKPEGILRLSDGSFLITEDTPSGRVVRVSPEGAVTTIFKDLDRPEGLAINKLGEIFVAETGSGRVLKISALGLDDERISTEISGITNPDQIYVSPDGSIWITKDIKNGRLLKYADGRLTTIVSGLNRPQGIAFAPDGTVLVAEQGKNPGRYFQIYGLC